MEGTKRINHADRNQPIFPLLSPYKAFDQYFSGVEAGPVDGQIDQLRLGRERVLRHVLERHNNIKNYVGADDRQRLEQHISGLDELVRRLELQDMDMAGTCTLPVICQHSPFPDENSKLTENRGNRPAQTIRADEPKENAIAVSFTHITRPTH